MERLNIVLKLVCMGIAVARCAMERLMHRSRAVTAETMPALKHCLTRWNGCAAALRYPATPKNEVLYGLL